MQPHLDVEFDHLSANAPAQAAARAGMDLLQRTCPDMSACRVTVAGPADGHHLCDPLCVQIRIQVPGAALSVNQMQKSGDALEATVRQAFVAAHRRLLEWMDLEPGVRDGAKLSTA